MGESTELVETWTDESISTIHHAMRAPRRRLAVGLVACRTLVNDDSEGLSESTLSPSVASDESLGVRELSREIVSIEQGVAIEHATGNDYHSVYTTLSQTHLPELDDVGAVIYDADRQRVAPDHNLHVFTIAAMITSSIAQTLLDASEIECYAGGAATHKSITD